MVMVMVGIRVVRPVLGPAAPTTCRPEGGTAAPSHLAVRPLPSTLLRLHIFSFFFHDGEILHQCSVNCEADEQKPVRVEAG